MRVLQDLEVHGDQAAIKRWLDLASGTTVQGWYRDQHREEKLPSYFCFTRNPTPNLPEATVYLVEEAEGLKAANVVPIGHNLSIAEYNQILREFHDCVAVPVADEARVRIYLSVDTLRLDDAFPPAVLQKLVRFSQAANKSTGVSHPSDRKRWLEFVVAAHHAQVKIGEDTFARLLEEELGWSPDWATILAGDYMSALEVLQFNDSRRAAVA